MEQNVLQKKIITSSEIAGRENPFQEILKTHMKNYGKEIKAVLHEKAGETKICDVYSGGGAHGFYTLGRILVMSFLLERYGIFNIHNIAGNSVGGAQATLMSYYQAFENLTYRQACYRIIGDMMNMGELKVNKWNIFLGLFNPMTVKQVTPENPMENLANVNPVLKQITYQDLKDKGYNCFSVFSELVASTGAYAGPKLTLKQGMQYTTRFYPPALVKEDPLLEPNMRLLVDGGISTNLPTFTAMNAFNNKKGFYNPIGDKLDFMIVSFLGNVNHYDYRKVKTIPEYFQRLLDFVSVKATAKGIKQTVLSNQQYKVGDREYVPLIPFGAFQDCDGEGVLTFTKSSYRKRFKNGVDLAIEMLTTMKLITKKEAERFHQYIYSNVENDPNLALMKLS